MCAHGIAAQQVLSGIGMRAWYEELSHERQTEICAEAMRLLEQGVLRPAYGRKFAIQEAAEAIVHAHQAGRGGKPLLVLT